VNRLKSSGSCRICKCWLEGLWSSARTPEQREAVWRQIDSGLCDSCQRDRQSAAVEYMAASDEMRLFLDCMMAVGGDTADFRGGTAGALINRVKTAERKCVDLGMWPWSREVDTPEQFRVPPKYRPRGRTHADHSYQ
jgi:hypothetical protein